MKYISDDINVFKVKLDCINMPVQHVTLDKFKLKILPDNTPEEIEKSKKKLRRDDRRFRSQYLGQYTYNFRNVKDLDNSVLDLLVQVEIGTFWRVLTYLDGYHGGHGETPESKEKKESRRKWAREKFNDWDLETLLNISVNQALLTYEQGGFPGYLHGHDIVYDHLVEKEDSMFKGVVDSELIKKLNNGRFWEMLYNLGPGGFGNIIVEDVLRNHCEDLSLDFVPRGFQIFLRNKEFRETFYLGYLSNEAIDKYASLMEGIFSAKLLKKEEFRLLVDPYIRSVIGEVANPDHDNYGMLRFEDFGKRLQEKFVSGYVKRDDSTRSMIADELTHLHPENAQEVLPFIYKPEDILMRVLKKSPHSAQKILGEGGKILEYRGRR